MSQDLVKALGVDVYKGRFVLSDGVEFVFAEDLRAALEKLPVVYGFSDSEGNRFNDENFPSDTHSARLFAIEEIKKDPLKHEYECKVTESHAPFLTYWNVPDNLKGKRVKVTVEEIVGE